jgi:hypothetical protein
MVRCCNSNKMYSTTALSLKQLNLDGRISVASGQELFEAIDARTLSSIDRHLHAVPYQPGADGYPSTATEYIEAA